MASAVPMTSKTPVDSSNSPDNARKQVELRLTEEIKNLESEFKARRAGPRPLTRSVAAAYRRSIEQRADQLKSLEDTP